MKIWKLRINVVSLQQEKKNAMTKDEAMARFMAAKEKKRQCVKRLEEKMKVAYEERTGKPAQYTFVL